MMNKDFLKRIKMPYPAKLKQQWGAFQKFWYYNYLKKNEHLLGTIIHIEGASNPSRFNKRKLCAYITEQDDIFYNQWRIHHSKKKTYNPIDQARKLYIIAKQKNKALGQVVFPLKHFMGSGLVGILARRIPNNGFAVLHKKVANGKKFSSATKK
jgi:hypothetical protein